MSEIGFDDWDSLINVKFDHKGLKLKNQEDIFIST